MMRQPLVKHVWSTKDSEGNWKGSFYGTWDQSADLDKLPTPAEVISDALGPPSGPVCNIAGVWNSGNGDPSYPMHVTQHGNAFLADCMWKPAPGRVTPWHNRSGTLRSDGHVSLGHDQGLLWPSRGADCGSVVCWSPTSYWCRHQCPSNITKVCATWSPPKVSSYFGLEWFVRDNRRIFRNVLRSGSDLHWLMLYTGPEAATGGCN